jgi:hypothetical protein
MTIADSSETVLAFIDALGVVIARLIVVIVISTIGILPYALVVMLAGDSLSSKFFWFSVIGFLSINVLLYLEYYLFAFKNFRHSSEVVQFFNELLVLGKLIFTIIAIPGVLMYVGVIFPQLFISGKSYVRQMSFDILGLYFCSLCSFVAAIYALSSNAELSAWMFDGTSPKTLKDAVLFGLEIATRGFFFDLFEHFHIHISPFQQSADVWGRILTFLLRLSSAALAISLVYELIKATKVRLEKLDMDSP